MDNKKVFTPVELKNHCRSKDGCSVCNLNPKSCYNETVNYTKHGSSNPYFWTKEDLKRQASFLIEVK